MQAAFLMVVYILTTMLVQGIGFGISRVVDSQWPAAGIMTFMVIFLAAFGVAWPLAVRIAEWGIRKAGYEVQGKSTV